MDHDAFDQNSSLTNEEFNEWIEDHQRTVDKVDSMMQTDQKSSVASEPRLIVPIRASPGLPTSSAIIPSRKKTRGTIGRAFADQPSISAWPSISANIWSHSGVDVTDLRSSDDEEMKGLPISKLVVRHEQIFFEISSQGDEVLSIFLAPTSSSSSSSFKGFIQSSSAEQVRASYGVEGVGGKIPTMSAKRQREEKKGELPVSSKVSKTAITSLQRCSPPLADSFTISSHPLSGKQSSVPVSSSFPISKVSSSASSKVSLGGRQTSAAFARPPLPAISFVPSVISTTSFYGVPVNNKSVLLYPLPWAPKGWTMLLPTRLSLEKNLSPFEKMRSIGNGIGGNLLLGFPMAPCPTGDSTDLANANLANKLISYYRKYFELCCIHILLDKECPKCDEPPSAVSPPGRLTSSLMKKGSSESMLFLGRLFDSKNTRAGTKGKGMGTAASHNEDASVSLQRIREVSGNPHLIISGDVLGATGGMKHLMNLQHDLWIKYDGKDIPVGDMNEMAAAYDRKHGTKTKKMANVVQVLLNDKVSNGEAVDRVEAAAQYDLENKTNHSLSASVTQQVMQQMVTDGVAVDSMDAARQIDKERNTNHSLSGSVTQQVMQQMVTDGVAVDFVDAARQIDEERNTNHSLSGPVTQQLMQQRTGNER